MQIVLRGRARPVGSIWRLYVQAYPIREHRLVLVGYPRWLLVVLAWLYIQIRPWGEAIVTERPLPPGRYERR